MSLIPPEPIRSDNVHRPHGAHPTPGGHPTLGAHSMHGVHHQHAAQRQAQAVPTARPASIDALIATVQREFPLAGIRITGRGRTVQRQAELMAQRRRQNRAQFLGTYRPAPHITEMDNWVTAHSQATEAETTAAFTEIITRARQNGAVVSNHLSDHARDISIPLGTLHVQQQVRQRLQALGAHVIDEHDAVGGPHWHVDF